MSNTNSHQIVFIDSAIEEWNSLVASFTPGTNWHLINSEQDGLVQIAARLQGQADINAIHIISHGADGTLSLGDGVITRTSLNMQRERLESIGNSLSDSGEILIYGCNVAKTLEGRQFIDTISQCANTRIAA